MTDYHFAKPWLIIIFAGGPLIMGIALILHMIYMTRHLPTMLKAMKNSSAIASLYKVYSYTGPIGKLMLIGQIAGLVVRPKIGIKGGFISREDIENFPPKLMRMLKTNLTIMNIATIWGLAFYAALKLELLN